MNVRAVPGFTSSSLPLPVLDLPIYANTFRKFRCGNSGKTHSHSAADAHRTLASEPPKKQLFVKGEAQLPITPATITLGASPAA